MTMVEEIVQAMEHGASTMFLLGMIALHDREPLRMLKAIEAAAEVVRSSREVKVRGTGTRYVNEVTFRLNAGNVANHTLDRLDSFIAAVDGQCLTYKRLTA